MLENRTVVLMGRTDMFKDRTDVLKVDTRRRAVRANNTKSLLATNEDVVSTRGDKAGATCA